MGVKQSRNHHQNGNERRGSTMRNNTINTTTTANKQQQNSSSISQSTNSIMIDGREYHNVDTSSYFLPKDELEQDRLNSQHFALKAILEGNVLPSVTEVISSHHHPKVLDLGCGSGCWVMEMAIDHPEYELTGLDMSDMFPTTIRPKNVKFELHNVLDGLPYPDNTFDFVHMRLMITALRATEWPFVLKEIYRVLKPGGLVQLVESDFTGTTNVKLVDNFNDKVLQAMKESGQDPWIAPKLSKMLTDINLVILEEEEKILSYSQPLQSVAREFLENWKSAMLSLKPLLADRLTNNPDTYNAIVDSYIEALQPAGWKVGLWVVCGQKPDN